MAQGAPLILLAVFGQPVSQSLSPRIHGLFARQCGLEIEYRAIEASADTFRDQLEQLHSAGGLGCNVTAPLKNEAWRVADRASAGADRAEAANTLRFSKDEWYADNTDGGGLVWDLQTSEGFELPGMRVCLLGAGGAAAGVLGTLLSNGPQVVFVANRTVEKAQRLAQRHIDIGPVEVCALDALAGTGPFDLIINATSLGHRGQAPKVSPGWLADGGLCYDMNYGGAAEPLRERCREQGIAYRDGLGMLVGQAALSFELWTGKTPDGKAALKQLAGAN
mgnify:CR=1 FL=1|jgi:shikimate dehydrogenase